MVFFLICIIFDKNDFFLISRCPIPLYAKVEKLILLFSNLVGHTECISNSLNNECGPETIADERPKLNVLLTSGLDWQVILE